MAQPTDQTMSRSAALTKDVIAGIVVFLVALPLCLGIAVASNADPFSGIVSGIIGGIVVGMLSGSHTSVSGPAAGLTAVVAVQIATLGSFEAFLAAVLVAGVIQIVLGCIKAGIISAFVPSSVIKGYFRRLVSSSSSNNCRKYLVIKKQQQLLRPLRLNIVHTPLNTRISLLVCSIC